MVAVLLVYTTRTSRQIMIVIISPENDIHSLTVKKRIENFGKSCIIVDTEKYPTDMCLSFILTEDKSDILIEYDGKIIKETDVISLSF
ncbi:MAG: MvdC/MvdD family ATP grasp protein, partial [Bacteroidota bacterium]